MVEGRDTVDAGGLGGDESVFFGTATNLASIYILFKVLLKIVGRSEVRVPRKQLDHFLLVVLILLQVITGHRDKRIVQLHPVVVKRYH